MTEEEKKAISIVENIKFKKYKIYIAKEMKDEIRFYQTEEERKAIDIVLNLIEKLQKEINGAIDYVEVNAVYEDEDEKCTRNLDNIECNELLDILKGKYKY